MFEFIEPATILKKFIEGYYLVEINNSKEFLPAERVFPNGHVNMIFHYGTSSKFKNKHSTEYIEPRLVICGQQTAYYDVSLSGNTGMILIVFKPHGLKSFFKFPINEISNENISLNDLIKNEANELEDRLLNCSINSQRIFCIEHFLIERLILSKDFDRVEHAIKLIARSKGQIKTQYLAKEVCLGIKQFERIFSKHVGLNPKKFISIVRFQSVIEMQRKSGNSDLIHLALENGYYDQSHFIHDFKSLTGLSPNKFFNGSK